jgi:hypothetical protein
VSPPSPSPPGKPSCSCCCSDAVPVRVCCLMLVTHVSCGTCSCCCSSATCGDSSMDARAADACEALRACSSCRAAVCSSPPHVASTSTVCASPCALRGDIRGGVALCEAGGVALLVWEQPALLRLGARLPKTLLSCLRMLGARPTGLASPVKCSAACIAPAPAAAAAVAPATLPRGDLTGVVQRLELASQSDAAEQSVVRRRCWCLWWGSLKAPACSSIYLRVKD